MVDVRIWEGFHDHPKTIKLQRRCGDRGILAFTLLWIYAAKHRPDGCLKGLSDEDIEIACKWHGDPGQLTAALVEVGYLDGPDSCRTIHDWAIHQPWAVSSPLRAKAAKRKAMIRWHKAGLHQETMVEGCPLCEDEEYAPSIQNHADSIQSYDEDEEIETREVSGIRRKNAPSIGKHADSIQNYADIDAPLPLPLPVLKDKTIKGQNSSPKPPDYESSPHLDQLNHIVTWFHEHQPLSAKGDQAKSLQALYAIVKTLMKDNGLSEAAAVQRAQTIIQWGVQDVHEGNGNGFPGWSAQLLSLPALLKRKTGDAPKWRKIEASMAIARRQATGQSRRYGIDTDKILTHLGEPVRDDPELRRHLIQENERWRQKGRWADPDRGKPYTLDDDFVNEADTYPERQHTELLAKLEEKRRARDEQAV